jgi:hypothetical protein
MLSDSASYGGFGWLWVLHMVYPRCAEHPMLVSVGCWSFMYHTVTSCAWLHVVGLLSGSVLHRSADVHLLSGSWSSQWVWCGRVRAGLPIAASWKLVTAFILHVHVVRAALFEGVHDMQPSSAGIIDGMAMHGACSAKVWQSFCHVGTPNSCEVTPCRQTMCMSMKPSGTWLHIRPHVGRDELCFKFSWRV